MRDPAFDFGPYEAVLDVSVSDPVAAEQLGRQLLEEAERAGAPREATAAAHAVIAAALNNALRIELLDKHVELAVENIEFLSPRLHTLVLRLLASRLARAGHVGLADRTLRRAAEQPDGPPASSLAALLDDRAIIAALAGDLPRFLSTAQAALEATAPDSPLLAGRLLHVAQAARLVGNTALLRATLDSLSDAEVPVSRPIELLARVEQVHLGAMEQRPVPLSEIEDLRNEPLVVASPLLAACVDAALAERVSTSRPDEAARLAEQAGYALEPAGIPIVAFRLLLLAAELHRRLGDLDRGIELHRTCFEMVMSRSFHRRNTAAATERLAQLARRSLAAASGPAATSAEPPTLHDIDFALDARIDGLLAAAGEPGADFDDRADALEAEIAASDITRQARLALARAAACVNRRTMPLAAGPLRYLARHLDALPTRTERLRALRGTARVLLRARYIDEARALLVAACNTARETRVAGEYARALMSIGVHDTDHGDPATAIDIFEQTLDLVRSGENLVRTEIEPICLAALGFAHRTLGRPNEAFATLREAEQRLTPHAYPWAGAQIAQEKLAALCQLGAPVDLDAWRERLATWRRNGWHQQVADAGLAIVQHFGLREPAVGREFGELAVASYEADERWEQLLELLALLVDLEAAHGSPASLYERERYRAELAVREHAVVGRLQLALDSTIVELERQGWFVCD